MFEALRRLIPALLRHFVAYGDLFVDEAADAVRDLRRQIFGLAVLMTAGGLTALLACVWVIAASWDGPHRMLAIGSLCIGFALIALAGAWYAKSGVAPGQPRPFERLHAEWQQDLEQLAALYPSLAADEPPTASPTPEHLYVD